MRRVQALLILVVAAGLAGCGYRPLYGTTAAGSPGVAASLSSISIPEAADRTGQLIRNDLISSMQPGAGEDKYSLVLKTEVKKSGIIQKTQPAVTRQAVLLTVSYELMDRASGTVVNQGKTFSQASYDVIRQPFADLQAETDATERAAHEVSADLRTRLAAYFATKPAQ